MDILSTLSKSTTKQSRRIGRGIGSKKGGHTSSRGSKGDKVRGTTRITFDGTKIKKGWIKRTPFLRGKFRLTPQTSQVIFNLDQINNWFEAGDTVTVATIAKKAGLKESDLRQVKILGKGKLTKALNFQGLQFSQNSADQIKLAGGKID